MERVIFYLLLTVLTILLCMSIQKAYRGMSFLKAGYIAFSAVFVFMATAALGLTLLQRFTLMNMNGLLAVSLVFLLLWMLLIGRGSSPAGKSLIGLRFKAELRQYLGILLIAIVAFSLYISFTTEYLLGGRDPGVYTVLGGHIYNSGGLTIMDETITTDYDRLKDLIRVGYPGFYPAYERGIASEPGSIVPQFLPLFPAILAVGYALAGIAGALKLNAFIALLALIAFYAFAKDIVGKKAALLATAFLALNPAQLWNARITQTELLSQFLFFAAMAIFAAGYRRNSYKMTAISGLLLGLSCFNRIDSYIFGLGIYVCTAYIILLHRKKVNLFLATVVPYTLLMGLSMVYGYLFSYPYYYDLWKDGSLAGLVIMNLLFGLLVPLAYLVRYFFVKYDTRKSIFKGFFKLKRCHLPQWTAGGFFLLFLFAYYVRPRYFSGGAPLGTEGYFRANALVEFGYYVPVVAMLFGILGLYFLIKDKGLSRFLIFLSIALASIIGYIYRPSITPDHVWASRRWITVNLPAVFLLAAYGIRRIQIRSPRLNWPIKVAVVAIILCFTFIQSSLFLYRGMLTGYSLGFAEAAEALPPHATAFTDEMQVASPLTYIYQRRVYILKESAILPQLAAYMREEDTVYGVGWPKPMHIEALFGQGISVQKEAHVKLSAHYPDKKRGGYPRALFTRNYDLSVSRLDYLPQNLYYTYSLTSDFYTQNGIYQKGAIESNGQAGFVLFGNYTPLSAGHYTFQVFGTYDSVESEEVGYIDVATLKGEQIIEKVALVRGQGIDTITSSVSFYLDTGYGDVELRLYTAEGVYLSIDRVILMPTET